MKTKIIIAAIIFFFALQLDAKPDPGISINFFYSALRPYGEWIQLDGDLVVWRPFRVAAQWRPYSVGRWAWTEDGWYWDSDEPFGWATYHYGRWYYDDYYGWIWVPDNQWGPAWVEWRYNDDYIGWAPLPPYASFSIDFGIHFSIGWRSHYRYWNFVDYGHFCGHRVNYYLVNEYRTSRIFDNTRYRNNYYYDRDRIVNGGVDRAFVERRAGSRIAQRDLRTVDNYGDYGKYRSNEGNRIVSYRPSERELTSGRDRGNLEIKRGNGRTTLERDKIVTRMDQGDNRAIDPRERSIRRDGFENRDQNINPNRDLNMRRDAERNPSTNRNELRNQDRMERQQNNQIQREVLRERPQVYERPRSNDRPQAPERMTQPQRQPNYDRPSPRSERSDRNVERSQGRSERGSDRSAEKRR
ncbi:MAG: hypothetical protein M1495_10780 [Bacteroidetes bacterium]|nr:hypothetical protein [Bacteroidota bacterium]